MGITFHVLMYHALHYNPSWTLMMIDQKPFLGANAIYISLATMRVLALSDTNFAYCAIPTPSGWTLVLQPKDHRKRLQVLASQRAPSTPRFFRTLDAVIETARECEIPSVICVTTTPPSA
jgi:hypothetical protein